MYYFIIASLSVLGICNIRSTSGENGNSHCLISGILLSNIDFRYFLNWDFSCSPEYNATEKVFYTVTAEVRRCHTRSFNGTFDTWVEFDDGYCHRKPWTFTIAASINGSEIANATRKYYGLGRADKISLSPPITTLSNNCGDTKIYLRPSIRRLEDYYLEYSVRLYYFLPGNQTEVVITKDVKEHKEGDNSTIIEKSVSNVSSTICVEASLQISFTGKWKSSPTTVCENSTCSDAEQTRTTTVGFSTSPSSDTTSMAAIIATGVILLLAVVIIFLGHQWRAMKNKEPELPNSTKQVINSRLCDTADEVVWKSEYLSMIKPLVQFESYLDGCEVMDSNSVTAGRDFPDFQKHSETDSSSSDALPDNESMGYVSEVCLSREVRSQNSSNQNFDPGMEAHWPATTLNDSIQATLAVECEELATDDRSKNPSTDSAFCDNATDKELSLAPMPAETPTIAGDDCSDIEYVMLPTEN